MRTVLNSVLKYNLFRWIRGLHSSSRELAGKDCSLDPKNGFSYQDFERSVRRDGRCSLEKFGIRLSRKKNFPSFAAFTFPNDEKKVRDFFRLVLRTNYSLEEAARATDVKANNMSAHYVNLEL